MDAKPPQQPSQHSIGRQPYIDEEVLRPLARMIARDILHRTAFFNTVPNVAKSAPQQKGSAKEKENEPSS